MPNAPLISLAERLYRRASDRRHRLFVVLQGPSNWLLQSIGPFWDAGAEERCCWISDKKPAEEAFADSWLRTDRSRQLLGQELDRIVIDASAGLDPDALGALSGTVRAGGSLVLLLPPFEVEIASPFQCWLQRCLEQQSGAERAVWLIQPQTNPSALLEQLEQPSPLSSAPLLSPTPITGPASQDPDCLSEDQAQAVDNICRVLKGHRRRPLVISADRGRGKTAALGIAAARLMQQGPCRIRITAPSKASVHALFERLSVLLPDTEQNQTKVRFAESVLEFVALDRLLSSDFNPQSESKPGVGELLLVDEAAAIPAPMLEQLLQRHARIVFATTTHGYEGTGRGFLIRFTAALQKLTPQWRRFELQQPIRWNSADPLEQWVFSALMLDAEPAEFQHAEFSVSDACSDRPDFRRWTPEQLLQRPGLLKQLFGLLVLAHYRTSPSDLRDLLDGHDRQVWLLTEPDSDMGTARVLGVVLLAEEGGFDSTLCEQIWLGQRRPQGHLLPQVLCTQSGWQAAAELRYWRVVRIAVVEPLRRCGFGSLMLQRLIEEAGRQPTVDVLGTSFAASAELLSFWSSKGFKPLRLGLKADGRSGAVSLLYGLGCSDRARTLLDQIHRHFSRDLPSRFSRDGTYLEPGLVQGLLADSDVAKLYPLETQDRQDITSFLLGNRGLQLVESALQRWLLQLISEAVESGNPLTDAQTEGLLIRCLLQQWPKQRLLAEYRLSGEAQLRQRLKQQLQPLWHPAARLEQGNVDVDSQF